MDDTLLPSGVSFTPLGPYLGLVDCLEFWWLFRAGSGFDLGGLFVWCVINCEWKLGELCSGEGFVSFQLLFLEG